MIHPIAVWATDVWAAAGDLDDCNFGVIRDIKVAIENMLNQDADMIEHVLVLLGDNGIGKSFLINVLLVRHPSHLLLTHLVPLRC